MSIGVWLYVWVFDSIDQPVCFYANTVCFFIAIALQHSLKSGMVIPPDVLLLSRIVLAILFLFSSPCEVEYCPFNACKELCWNFDVDCFC